MLVFNGYIHDEVAAPLTFLRQHSCEQTTFSECTIHGRWMAVNLPLAPKESQEVA